MPILINLVWRYMEVDYSGLSPVIDIDTLDLLNYNNGIKLADNGWTPAVAEDGQKSVIEVITLRLKDASNDDLAAVVQSLDLYKKRVGWARETIAQRGVYLRARMENETYTREAFISRFEYKLQTSPYDLPFYRDSLINEVVITLERTPFWEPQSYITTKTNSDIIGISCDGGTQTISTVVTGDVPARIERLAIYPDADSNLRQFWMGWRTNRNGFDPADFAPKWDLTLTSSDSFSADTSVSGDHLLCDFTSSTALIQRCSTSVDDITLDSDAQIGTYLVLLRASISNLSGTVRVRMKYGYADAGTIENPSYRSLVPIDSTSPKLYELGNASLFAITGTIARSSIGLEVERTSGTATISLFELILIPLDEGSIATFTTFDLVTTYYMAVWNRVNGQLTAYVVQGAYTLPDRYIVSAAKVTENVWGMPANGVAPMLVFAGQGTSHDPAQTCTIEYTIANNWRTLRGNAI